MKLVKVKKRVLTSRELQLVFGGSLQPLKYQIPVTSLSAGGTTLPPWPPKRWV